MHNYPICVRLVYCVTCTDILATITSKGIFLLYTTCMVRYLKNMYRAFDSTVCSLIRRVLMIRYVECKAMSPLGCLWHNVHPTCMNLHACDLSLLIVHFAVTCYRSLPSLWLHQTPLHVFTWFVYTQSDKLCFWTRVDIECAHAIKLFSHNSSKDTDSGCLL
jgi:hypothetical protein